MFKGAKAHGLGINVFYACFLSPNWLQFNLQKVYTYLQIGPPEFLETKRNTNQKHFAGCNVALLSYGAPMFSTVNVVKWAVLGLQRAFLNLLFLPNVA